MKDALRRLGITEDDLRQKLANEADPKRSVRPYTTEELIDMYDMDKYKLLALVAEVVEEKRAEEEKKKRGAGFGSCWVSVRVLVPNSPVAKRLERVDLAGLATRLFGASSYIFWNKEAILRHAKAALCPDWRTRAQVEQVPEALLTLAYRTLPDEALRELEARWSFMRRWAKSAESLRDLIWEVYQEYGFHEDMREYVHPRLHSGYHKPSFNQDFQAITRGGPI